MGAGDRRGLNATRWAEIGITIQFLALVRTLGEFFRLRHATTPAPSVDVLEDYVVGASIAAVLTWVSVTLFFLRRHGAAAMVAALTMLALLVYRFGFM